MAYTYSLGYLILKTKGWGMEVGHTELTNISLDPLGWGRLDDVRGLPPWIWAYVLVVGGISGGGGLWMMLGA